MNGALICVCLPVVPFLIYLVMPYFGVSSIYRVILPEIFIISYVIMISILIVKRVSKDEELKKKK
ncbi:hypothetical protein NEFER03_0011 [Nematocida sp. LUAm3]|nr:hypothetical protein NEFER03_0011 [Nematocida sp. LUAm3]KAI5173493.1 hypothetical protein NEFER02_0009 [Nematocida sp. LUAm2]KAI5176686.1 hypothetical protein NEFER01_0011 [Nematocida sp. LUAm1]